MRFEELIEAPRNDPEELKRRTDRAKGTMDKQQAQKDKISSRASELGKKGAQQRKLNKDFKSFNMDLRKDELEKREAEKNKGSVSKNSPEKNSNNVDSQGRIEPTVNQPNQPTKPNQPNAQKSSKGKIKKEIDDTILQFIKQQIKDRKRQQGIDGDQGVEEKDVVDFAKYKYPDANPEVIDKMWAEVKGQDISMAADNKPEYDPAPQQNNAISATRDDMERRMGNREYSQGQNNYRSNYRSNYQSKSDKVDKVMSSLRKLSKKDLIKFRELINNG